MGTNKLKLLLSRVDSPLDTREFLSFVPDLPRLAVEFQRLPASNHTVSL